MKNSETLAETMLLTRDTAKPRLRLRFVALVVAIAVALGLMGTAAPARAGNDDLVKALAALAIVGIIAHGLDQPRRDPPVTVPPKPVPQPVRGPRVPAVCALILRGAGGPSTVFGENCLRGQGFAWRLPVVCGRPARIYGRDDRIFDGNCLRNAGFRVGSA